ncbi:MAG TPA: hypothetical protein VEK11_07345 [Thermoanaerobaculia bacterium]|nr:hypothetical protein [Thermoanaerobaculia bacterium]
MNPTSQFHPYTPETSVPQTGNTNVGGGSGLSGILSKVGLDQSKIGALGGSLKNMDLSKARGMAQNNGGLVLGGLAALAIGVGLMRRRGMSR